MKLLVMCEGQNEKKIMEILLAHKCLSFDANNLLGLSIFHARQITKSAQVRTHLNMYPEQVKVLRIGDKQSDVLKIPNEYKNKIVSIEKFCTKPELEMLLIIACNMLGEYEKNKSKMSPKEFAKQNIKYNDKPYDNSTQFYDMFFGNRVELLVDSIKEYQRLKGKTHDKTEHCLAELIH